MFVTSTQLLDHSIGDPINANCPSVQNDIPLLVSNFVEPNNHFDASSEGRGSTITSVTFNTSQESVQDKVVSGKSHVDTTEKNPKHVSICLKHVDQMKVNTTSKQN